METIKDVNLERVRWFIETRTWHFAKTRPEIPHWYCLRTEGEYKYWWLEEKVEDCLLINRDKNTMKKIDDESKKNWVQFCVRSGIEGEVRKANPGKYREVLPDGRIKYKEVQLLLDTSKKCKGE